MGYLPKDASIEQACKWLEVQTGETWGLSRLIECHLRPYFWLDFTPGYPAIFGERIEGYQTRMMFHGDLCRLESDGADALVNMFSAHDGSLIKAEPALRVPLSELRFKRTHLERLAEIINKSASKQPETLRVLAVGSDAGEAWTVRKPQRFKGYSVPLFRLLAAAHQEGKPRPTARDVLEVWRLRVPAEIAKVLPDGIDYYDANGDTKTAGLEAIRKVIGRMTDAK